MWNSIWQFFIAIYSNPNVEGIGIALIMGAIWLAIFRMPLGKQPRLWTFLAVGALLFGPTIGLLQFPLQIFSMQALFQAWGAEIWQERLLVSEIPAMLITGFVQEGIKLVPVLIYRKRRQPLPDREALLAGAAVGAGFGIFEAAWLLNQVFTTGFSLPAFRLQGWQASLSFWERLFIVGFHTSTTALAAYWFNRGKGSRAYLAIALFHSIMNYGVILAAAGVFTIVQTEIYITVLCAIMIGAALWLRWHDRPAEPTLASPPEAGAPA
ncbi:MAG TPA: hypothetical protein DCG78_04240 [Anaerolineaceae bacterium]|nr:hypothetical protein [Anaerolineaceae bacterium]